MKTKISIVLLSALALFSIGLISGCNKDEKSEDELYLEKLSFTWKVRSVTVDGKDVTSFFSNMALTVKGNKTYEVVNGVDDILSPSGTFAMQKVNNNSHFTLVLNNGVDVTITGLTDTQLDFKLTYNAPGGRVTSVGGEYQFVMEK